MEIYLPLMHINFPQSFCFSITEGRAYMTVIPFAPSERLVKLCSKFFYDFLPAKFVESTEERLRPAGDRKGK